MRRFGRALGRVLLALGVLAVGLWVLGPRERLALRPTFDAAQLPEAAGLDAYLARAEDAVGGVRPGARKRIFWAGAAGARTEVAVVYLHGFAASSGDISPVPEEVARRLGANLYLARLAGHGVDGARLAEVSAQDWVNDTAEAIAIGARLGDRVMLIGTSTGGTLAALAANQPALAERLAGVVMISPNFGLRDPRLWPLTWPLARYWVPLVAGGEQCLDGLPPQGEVWTRCFPTAALFQMAELAEHVGRNDYFGTGVPALVLYSPEDQVVSADRIEQVAGPWAGPMVIEPVEPGPGDDPRRHVILGDLLSPGQTEWGVDLITDWISRHKTAVDYGTLEGD